MTRTAPMTAAARVAARVLPEGAVAFKCKGTQTIAYAYTVTTGKYTGRVCVKIYEGTKQKASVHTVFKTEQARSNFVRDYFAACLASVNRKAEQNVRPASVEVGTVFRCSWGYEQTNVDFYVVRALIGDSMAEIEEIGKTALGSISDMSGYTMPNVDAGTGRTRRVKVTNYAGSPSIRLSSFEFASVWDGTKCYESSTH